MQSFAMFPVLRARIARIPSPVAVGFEITHRCNLRCQYCDRNRGEAEMSREEIFRVLEGLHRLGMRAISLDGGEPLMSEHVDSVVDWLHDRGVVLRINTNGVLVGQHKDAIRRMSKVKISLDGPAKTHDAARGERAFDRAVRGALLARELGASVELTCVVGPHNSRSIDELLDIAATMQLGIVFQPMRKSLLRTLAMEVGPEVHRIRHAFHRVQARKAQGAPVLNGWSSLRHFQSWPAARKLPCAAGWINATPDPQGNLYACGQTDRLATRKNAVELGVQEAFRRLARGGCAQCWCARVVEENYAWGLRFQMNLPICQAQI